MAKKPATFNVEESVLESVAERARRSGRSQDDVVEEALRRGVASSVVEEVAAREGRPRLTEDEALRLAYEELHAARRERRTGRAAS